jgi:hypothetical protein
MRLTHRSVVVAVFLLIALVVPAQVVITSSIVGSVTDQQKAVIAGAEVRLRNQGTGAERVQATNSSGEYQFPSLQAGNYQVEVIARGFGKSISTAISLENGTTQRVDVVMKIGETQQTVEVTEAAGLVKTDDANISDVIQNQFVRELPIEGRNFLNYAQIAPNFNSGSEDRSRVEFGLATGTAPSGTKQLNVGGTEYGVGYYLDGLNNNDNWVGGPVTNVNTDTIQEVKAEVANYSAEYGRDPGQISLTTKSGTNDLHGTIYDFFQNSGMNAADPYANAFGEGRNPYHQNQYGFTVGGPVYIPKVFNGRNKLFFFASFEQLRNRGQTARYAYVPTEAERTGDFSEWLNRFPVDPSGCDGSEEASPNCRFVIYNPYSYDPDSLSRQPYANNIIPNPDPKALAYLSHFPTPNYTSPVEGDFNNWTGKTTDGINNNNYTTRVDYNISQKDTFYFRFSHDYGTRLSSGGLVPELALGNGPVHSTNIYQFHWVHTFGTTFNNEVNFSLSRSNYWNTQSEQVANFMKSTWLPELFQNTSSGNGGLTDYDKSRFGIENDGIFSIGFAGDLFTPLSVGSGEYFYQYIPIYQLSDNAIKAVGRHTMKFGFYWQRRDERDNDLIRSMTIGGYCPWCGAESGYTGRGPLSNDGSGWNTLAEFETGAVFTMNQRTPLTGGDGSLWFRMPEYSAYFNDSWNVTPKLSLSLGLRYDVGVPAYSVDNYWGVMDFDYPGYRLVMPGLTPGTHNPPYPADKNNVAPRVGLAYRLNDKTVIRSGYGMFYETGGFKFMDQMFWNSPGYGGTSYNSADLADDPNQPFFTLNDVFPAPITLEKGTWPIALGDGGGQLFPRQDTQTIDYDTAVTPYIQRWSLDIQRELGRSTALSIGYVGSEGTKLTTQFDRNLPAQGIYLDSDEFYEARPLTAIAPERWEGIQAVHHNRSNNYHALNVQLKTQGWHGLTSDIGYTWSKQMDTIFGESGQNGVQALGGQWHPEWSYAPSDANHTNRFVAALVYELPGERLGNRFLREAIGGWQVSTIATFESGRPTTIWNGHTSSFDYMGDVDDQTCDGNLPRGERSFTRQFNTDCYVAPDADPGTGIATHRGNQKRNGVRQPGINNWDMALAKSFHLAGERRLLQVRAEAFNVFNHTQWLSVNDVDDRADNPASQFGYVTDGRPGRHLQLALKFIF